MPATVLFHCSDIHFGIEDRAALTWFEDAVRKEAPDMVICTGDLTQRAKRREYDAAREWFSGLGVPVMLEVGNHDMPYYSPIERFRTPFKRFSRLVASLAAVPEFDDIAFVSLVTTVSAQRRWPWSDGVIRQHALDAALGQLERLRGDDRLKLVTCHHPLVSARPGRRNKTIGGNAAVAALAAAGADAVLSGHIHTPFDLVHDIAGRRLRLIGSGTMSSRLRGSPPSYNVIKYSRIGGLEVVQRQYRG